MTFYKWLNGREATHVPGFRYRLRVWTPDVKGELVACENGYHLNREQDLLRWIAHDLFVAEARGDLLKAGDKVVVRSCRIVEHLKGWNDTSARLFAADCAERVLPLFEAKYPNDDRPRLAIQAAREYARGEITAAARDAARAAAWAAVRAPAWAAAWAAVRDAARDAARAAVRDAARDAARAAAWAAARDAAWDAAAAAARAAAWDAARDAARAAAWDAARAPAWAAERKWQTARLLDYAHGRLS